MVRDLYKKVFLSSFLLTFFSMTISHAALFILEEDQDFVNTSNCVHLFWSRHEDIIDKVMEKKPISIDKIINDRTGISREIRRSARDFSNDLNKLISEICGEKVFERAISILGEEKAKSFRSGLVLLQMCGNLLRAQ